MSSTQIPINSFIFFILIIFAFIGPLKGVSHNLLASSGIDSDELYLSRPLSPKEWDILGLKYIRTTINGVEKYKVDLPALEMLDYLAKIGYRVVGMTFAPMKAHARNIGDGGLWWTLVKETDE